MYLSKSSWRDSLAALLSVGAVKLERVAQDGMRVRAGLNYLTFVSDLPFGLDLYSSLRRWFVTVSFLLLSCFSFPLFGEISDLGVTVQMTHILAGIHLFDVVVGKS
ncbi:MAG: hypothetical protein ACREV1_03495 [Gammaproteobacteria bacterium]